MTIRPSHEWGRVGSARIGAGSGPGFQMRFSRVQLRGPRRFFSPIVARGFRRNPVGDSMDSTDSSIRFDAGLTTSLHPESSQPRAYECRGSTLRPLAPTPRIRSPLLRAPQRPGARRAIAPPRKTKMAIIVPRTLVLLEALKCRKVDSANLHPCPRARMGFSRLPERGERGMKEKKTTRTRVTDSIPSSPIRSGGK